MLPLLYSILQSLLQIQLTLEGISLGFEALPLRGSRLGELRAHRCNLRVDLINLSGDFCLHLSQSLCLSCPSPSLGGVCNLLLRFDECSFGPRGLERKLHNLSAKGFGVILVNRVARQAHRRNSRRGLAIPADDLVEMVQWRIAIEL